MNHTGVSRLSWFDSDSSQLRRIFSRTYGLQFPTLTKKDRSACAPKS
jgi:hypothetical protein